MNRSLMYAWITLVTLTHVATARASDAVVGTGTAASCTEAALDAALAQLVPGAPSPGGRVSFNCGSTSAVIAISSAKVIGFGERTVIDGGGVVTLDAGDLTRHFDVTGNDSLVEIRNLALVNGNAGGGNGGAIYVGTGVALLLDHVFLSNNRAGFSGGAIITETGSSVTLASVDLLDNTATNGGAIAANGSLTLSDCQLASNVATPGEGGAIQAYFNRTVLRRVTLVSNRALYGGGLLQRGGVLVIEDSEFIDNRADIAIIGNGGGLHASDAAEVDGVRTRFASNVAGDAGGAVYLGGITGPVGSSQLRGVLAVFSTSRFELNQARRGGGVFVFGVTGTADGRFAALVLEGSQLRNNTAILGGGIHSRGALSLNRTLVLENTAADGLGNGGGGGLALEPNIGAANQLGLQYTNLTETTLRGNVSPKGGGLHARDHALTLDRTNFIENVAQQGGGAWMEGKTALLPQGRAAFVRNFGLQGAGLALSLPTPIRLDFFTFADNRLNPSSGAAGRDVWLQANAANVYAELRHVTALNPEARDGAALHAESGAAFRLRNSIVFGGLISCGGAGSFTSEGYNVLGPSCAPGATDIEPASVDTLGLGELIEEPFNSYYLPMTASPVVDFAPCLGGPTHDQREKPLNQDGNGDNVVSCDAGAIERQAGDTPPSTLPFRDGFESP